MGYYYIQDPFMVLKKYTNYDKDGLVLNEHMIGWNTYMNNRDKIHYNSFILGNSCTMAFKCNTWEKHLDKEDKAIRLFGNAESLTAVLSKLKALEKNNAEIKNILFIVDYPILCNTDIAYNITHILPQEISGISDFGYQGCFIQTFLTPKFFISHFDYKIFKKYRGYMRGIINPYKHTRDTLNCDFFNPLEKEIERDKDQYWVKKKSKLKRSEEYGLYTDKATNKNVTSILEEINTICRRNNTRVKVLVSPNYNYEILNKEDLETLCNIFGKENVFDASSNEKYSEITYFYDNSHYRPILGELLLNEVYKPN